MGMVKGIDVASYQTLAEIEQQIKTGNANFGFVKATEGNHYVNPIHVDQAKLFFHNGKPVGFYHFLVHDVPAKEQWAHFAATIHPYRHSTIIAVDDERDSAGQFAPRELVKNFVALAHKNGYRIGRYASLATFEEGSVGADWRWIAYWNNTPPPLKFKFWQQQSESGGVDHDVFNGNVDQMHKFWHSNTKVGL
jgi:GH25 family lysozyme M1 (1,4-beta-N-acetylmuramidase)